jgi:HAE1 family hydrophobic/amphiphilic exporter-1
MYMRDISLNIMSLGGLALGVGMLVDNSIVVLESIFRCKEEGDDTVDAAERGTREVGSAVTASTLTTVCVFFPIVFVEGIAGQLFGDLALTVTFSLLASLLTALYLIPLIASRRSLSLSISQQVIWPLKAYRTGRNTDAKSIIGSIMGIVPLGLRYAGRGFVKILRNTYDPTLRLFSAGRGHRIRFILIPVGVIGLIILTPVFLLELILSTAGQLITTLLFLIFLLLFPFLFVFRWLFVVLFWGPLALFNFCFDGLRKFYRVALGFMLQFSMPILLAVVLLAVHAGYTARDLGSELIPPMKQGEFGLRMEANAGTRLEETESRAKRLEEVIRAMEEVASVTVEIGEESARSNSERGENVAEFTIVLKDPDRTARIQDEIIEKLRQKVSLFESNITFTLPSLFSFKTAVELQVIGDELTELKRVGERALERVQAVRGVQDAELSIRPGYPEIIIRLDRTLLAHKGISPGQVATKLRTEVQGEVATRFNQSGEKVDIRVRTDKNMLGDKEDLFGLSITDGVVPIPLRDVARIEVVEGPSEIRRVDQRQVALITANVEGRDLGAVSAEISRVVEDVERPADYYFMLGGQNRELETSYASLRFALILAIFLVYVVMACQFESVWHPALVMFSVPLAFIGVIYVLVWMDIDVSIMVFLGGIVLAGIVVNDAIVLVDYINQLRERGKKKRDAIIEAGSVRLRPIIMTTVTTVLGLLPMILAAGEGAELRRPMAITVMAGLTSATVLTLLIIPMVYYVFGGRDRLNTVETDAVPASDTTVE